MADPSIVPLYLSFLYIGLPFISTPDLMYVPVPVDSNLKQENQVLKKVNLVENLSPPDILTFSQHSKRQNNIEFQSNYIKHIQSQNEISKKIETYLLTAFSTGWELAMNGTSCTF